MLDYVEQHKDTNFSKRIASTSTHDINVFHGYRNNKSLHMHANSDKLIYVISGAGRFELNGRWHDLKQGDVVSVPRGTTHGIHSQGKERLVFLYVYTPPMVGKDMLEVSLALGAGREYSSREPVPLETKPDEVLSLRDAERKHILRVLERAGSVVEGPVGAAALLDINPSTLRSRMRKLGILRSG